MNKNLKVVVVVQVVVAHQQIRFVTPIGFQVEEVQYKIDRSSLLLLFFCFFVLFFCFFAMLVFKSTLCFANSFFFVFFGTSKSFFIWDNATNIKNLWDNICLTSSRQEIQKPIVFDVLGSLYNISIKRKKRKNK